VVQAAITPVLVPVVLAVTTPVLLVLAGSSTSTLLARTAAVGAASRAFPLLRTTVDVTA
jgi:hypothetical protein